MRIAFRHSPNWPKIILLFLVFASLACAFSVSFDPSTKSHPTERIDTLKAVFVGQDGGNYAGKLCSSGTANDNIHIRLTGLLTNIEPTSYRVEDFAYGGVWATPCDPVSNWFLYVKPAVNGESDIYFKPFRDAPERREYRITVTYRDGSAQTTVIQGLHVKP